MVTSGAGKDAEEEEQAGKIGNFAEFLAGI